MIFNYVRDKRHRKVGVVVALSSSLVGWSLCNIKKDRFDKEFGIKIATGRARVGTSVPMPHIIIPIFDKVVYRAKRYFK